MALYSRREFIEQLCGQQWGDGARSKIAMWIKRGKIIESGDKIDDTIPTNRDWILKQKGEAEIQNEIEAPTIRQQTQKKPSRKQSNAPESEIGGDGGETYYALDKQYKKQQVAKMKVDTRIAELKEEKIRGEVVPMELVKNIFTTHTQSILTAQKDGIEQLLIDFTMEARLTGAQLAKLRGRMVEILNKGVDKAITITQRNMKTLVDEFSIKREVGEHD